MGAPLDSPAFSASTEGRPDQHRFRNSPGAITADTPVAPLWMDKRGL